MKCIVKHEEPSVKNCELRCVDTMLKKDDFLMPQYNAQLRSKTNVTVSVIPCLTWDPGKKYGHCHGTTNQDSDFHRNDDT
jgi:hypothetical protein